MPFISVKTWPNISDDIAFNLMREITRVTAKVTGAPLDKITVVIEEIPKARWAEAGIIGIDPDFASKSRQS